MKTYCFDMDGVICNIDNDDYSKRTPKHKTIGIMQCIKSMKHTIIIHTGRHLNHMVATQEWLKENEVPHDHLQFGKPVADVYIDDKGMRFTDKWNEHDLAYLL